MKRFLPVFMLAVAALAQPYDPPPAAPLAPLGPLAQVAPVAPVAPMPPPAPGQPAKWARSMADGDWDNNAYRKGARALDDRRYDDAVKAFDSVVERKQTRADGALYWKAYALNKLGKRTEALASLDRIEKEYSGSAWLNDAKALRLEVQQNSGQPVSPESQSDEELKLLALNGIMHSDPDRALPLIEGVLTSASASPKVKERALFVLGQSRNPKAVETIMKIAKGGGNPDLQVKAIEYMGVFGARNEVAQLYSNSASPQVKEAIINSLMISKNVDKLVEIARTEPDQKMRLSAIERLGVIRTDKTAEILISLYSGDPVIKRKVIDGLFIGHHTHQMIELARKESDPKLKKELVERLSMMKDKEATDYMMELLK